MGIMQRRKGAAGERELFHLLADELGVAVNRNLAQSRKGGADSVDIAGWSVEVKRQEREQLRQWWTQTVNQCVNGSRPILFYRASRQPWRALIMAADVFSGGSDQPVCLEFQDACTVIREKLSS